MPPRAQGKEATVDLPPEVYEGINFTALDYRSLRPGYTYREVQHARTHARTRMLTGRRCARSL